jgi:hypothetical protein
MPGDNSAILKLARRLTPLVDAPVVGGVAVYLHGVPRATVDLDFYASDLRAAAAQLEAAGAQWIKKQREHVLDGICIHLISTVDAGVEIDAPSIIDGIRVVKLKDLVAIKLLSGLNNPARSKDLGDVEELIRAIPLDKRFATKLPAKIRPEFKTMVDAVRARERKLPDNRRF